MFFCISIGFFQYPWAFALRLNWALPKPKGCSHTTLQDDPWSPFGYAFDASAESLLYREWN